ncbi:MAG: translation initiation factor [Ignavibacteriales bacterium]|nr:translation initiation factor [Ignavibacteriales bacterium]
MKFKSFSGLQQLLPDSPQPTREVPDSTHDGKGKVVRLSLDTKGRKGKTVTLVLGLQHNPATMHEIARILKERCGTGGTVKEGTIELQGDQRTRAAEELRKMNYMVKA